MAALSLMTFGRHPGLVLIPELQGEHPEALMLALQLMAPASPRSGARVETPA